MKDGTQGSGTWPARCQLLLKVLQPYFQSPYFLSVMLSALRHREKLVRKP